MLSGLAEQSNWYDKQIVKRRIDCLNRPLSGVSADQLSRKRHNLYQKGKELENRLNNDASLQYFASSVGRVDGYQDQTILQELEDLKLYQSQCMVLPACVSEYPKTQKERTMIKAATTV